ncbi:ankyrin repeat domain-containing protein 26 isoform X8 [Malaclemys terrapin pileata]|uniref:ankyrin repeat domain-containing protein 26 isoform X8 n=1 Tax=Malaclemys terrapin pileata TaxID=2991368 RepID=UPI0023A7E24C|nr:ankyrin repeat domain-containing protein 26 isoform X8 [Malaclemys terrapin pileata]
MKKIFGFGKKKKGQSPACRASLPGVGYELREKELGKLHRAAAGGDLGKLQQLLKKHDINQLDKENRTPLHLACANGHLDVVTYLVDNKCKLNLCDNDNRSPLMKAVQCQQEKCATMLLEHGAEPNLVDVNSNTALHLAAQTANISLVVQLLEYNAHIDSQNKEGYTPLTIAITENHQEMVEFLLKKGADVHARDKSKRTPLMIAASGGELSLIKVLLQYGADVSHKDINGWTSEDHAHVGGYSSLSKQLSEYANWKNVEKPSPNNTKGMSVFSSPDRVGDVGFALGAPATDKEEMQQSPNQTSRTRDSGKVIDDLSQGDSVRSSEKDEGDDSWLTSEEEELDFTPKKPQKPSLTLLMNSSHQFKKNIGEKSSIMRTEHIAISQQNKSDCEAEDVIESPPKPFPQVKSYPRPVHPSPGSFSKPSQMTPPLLGFKQEESSEEEDDIEQPQISNVVDKSLICSGNREAQNPSEDTAIRKDTMSVLGLDEEEDTESPWDSECASESPRKLPVNLLISSAIRTDTHMQSIFEEPNEGFCEKTLDSQPKTTQAILETHDTSSCPAKGIEIGKRQKSDLMEELGLDDADDIEDASDWDSTSISLKNLPGTKSPKVLTFGNPSSSLSTLTAKDDAAATASGVIPPRLEEMSKAQTVTAPENTHLYSLQKQLLPVILKSKDELSEPSFNMPSPDEEREDAGENCKKQVEEEKRKQKCGEMLAMEKREDTYKSYMQTLAENGINQEMKQKLAIKGNQYSTVESGETTEEEKHMKNRISSKERAKLIQIPLKGSNSALNVKDVKKNENKKRISKQRGNQQMNSTNGNQFQVLDDSTLSETSQDEGRPGAKTVDERNKIGKQMDVADDFDELTQSSDTATEDLELPTSTYRDAMLLIEQLCMDGKADSVSILKIQNLLHGYERLIDHEKGRYTQLLGKVRKLENEKKELQTVLEETRELKSMLDHQKMEWESDVSSLKFTLKQEEEKRMSTEMLYEKNRELLRKKEDQYCKEMEEKQQLELTQRSLEMELRTLRNHLKQVEEERNETQRQLSQEQSARALQEGILNNHLWKQKEIEEETKITVAKSSEVPDNQREKDLLHKNQILQDEIAILRLELDQIRIRHQEEETKYLEENEVLREKNEDLRKELKLNEEALTQTVFQYNGQLNVLKTESAMLTSKIEHAKENKDRLETEMESFRSRLNSAVQELECCRKSKSDVERTLQREHDEWLRLQDKLNHDLSNLRDTNTILSQQLSKVETKANSLENELHHVTHTLREKTLLLESTQRDLSHAQCQAKEFDHARQIEKDQMSKYIVKQESMQERLAQLQSENVLLRQQLEDMQNKGIIKEKVVSDRFSDIFSKLRADTEKQVHMMEERNKELITKCNNLREQVFKYDTEKVEREGTVRQLQQELADALKKQSMSEASLEVTTRYRNDLEDDKLHLQKEIDKIKTKLQESEDQYIQSERRVHDLKNALDSKEREVNASSQKLQDLLIASSGTNNAIKQLEEHIQRLEIENARLEATTKQQTSRIEVLQKDLRDSASVHNRLEDLITGLQTAKINLEEQLNQQVQKQTMLSMTAKDTHNLWEEELKSRSKLGVRLSQLDREKAEMLEQFESERKKVKKLVELKRSVDVRLDQEMKRNSELQKECNGMKKLLKTAKKKLKEYETGECVSQFSFQGELKNRYSEMDNEVSRLRTKTDELSKKLDIESKKSTQLESTNRDLREQLSSMKILHKNHEKLEKSKWQLEGEVANLKHQVETNMMDHSQIEQYKREIEERARQEIRQKLEEVNLFLQTQAASQETLEQIRTTNNASLKNQLEHRIRDLESELARIKNTQEDSVFQKQSTQTELERYKDLYLEELKIRKSLASKLDRANERIAEANAKLLHERHRSKSLIANSIVNGSLAASPVLDTTQLGNLGNNLTLNRSLGLGGSFINPTGNALSSKNRVEAYLAKMQQELEKSITKELDQATAELETGSVRVSPVGSTDGSSKNLNVDQDPVSRATQQYLDVLKKNYMI